MTGQGKWLDEMALQWIWDPTASTSGLVWMAKTHPSERVQVYHTASADGALGPWSFTITRYDADGRQISHQLVEHVPNLDEARRRAEIALHGLRHPAPKRNR